MANKPDKSPHIKYIDAKAERLTTQANIRHWKAEQKALKDALRLNMTDGYALPAELIDNIQRPIGPAIFRSVMQ